MSGVIARRHAPAALGGAIAIGATGVMGLRLIVRQGGSVVMLIVHRYSPGV
jgi:hypothetical protein